MLPGGPRVQPQAARASLPIVSPDLSGPAFASGRGRGSRGSRAGICAYQGQPDTQTRKWRQEGQGFPLPDALDTGSTGGTGGGCRGWGAPRAWASIRVPREGVGGGEQAQGRPV